MNVSEESLVLIVDDNPQNLKVLGNLLREKGYRLAAAQNGTQALDFVGNKHPDIILLDYMMPDLNGIEVCEKIKSNEDSKDIPIIIVTGVTDTWNKVQAFTVGAVDYITKPFEKEEVLARVNTHLENSRLTKQLMKANHELQNLNALKNRFLGMAAHDLRTPLSVIKGYSALLASVKLGSVTKNQEKLLNAINRSSNYMLNLVESLLDVSAIESGQLDLVLEPGSLKDLVEDRLLTIDILAQKKDISLEASLEEVHDIKFDSNRIAQVIDNLLSNAIKYSTPGSKIIITLKESTQFAQLSVQDEGPGISREDQTKLFGDFQRLGTRPTSGEKSYGLGLSISQAIAKAHQGNVSFQSEVEVGSTFTLNLPKDKHTSPKS